MSETIIPVGTAINHNALTDSAGHVYDNMYTFITEAYEGSGGFASGEYLVKHPKEYNLANRKRMATYKNYTKGIIDSLLTPSFSTPAIRKTDNKLFEAFILDADDKGHNLQKLTNQVVKYTKLHGVCFAIMDNYDAVHDTIDDVIENRTLPYMYLKTADTLAACEYNDDGDIVAYIFRDGMLNDKTRYIKITNEYVVVCIKEGKTYTYTSTPVQHSLGTIPVIALYDSLSEKVLPFPPTYDLARLNWEVFNQDSEQRVIERNSAFAMLTLDTGGEDADVNLDIGTDTLLCYGSRDKTVNVPQWISPDPAILKNMMDISNNTVSKLVEVGNVLGAVATNSGGDASSGKALSLKFLGTSYAIKHTARLAEEFETMVATLFGLWTNTVVDYFVAYYDKYNPTIDEVKGKIDLLQGLLSGDYTDELKSDLKMLVVKELSNMFDIDVDKYVK